MKKRIFILMSALILLTVAVFTGCTPKETAKTENSTAASKSGGTLKYAIWSSPSGVFNPSLSGDVYNNYVVDLVYERLLYVDKNSNYVPGLADKYQISKDGLTITFNLNKKAKWQDGQPVTADDVAYTFTTIADPDYDGSRFPQIEKIVGAQDYKNKKATSVKGIKVIDSHTISFTFSEVFAPGLATFASRGILPKHVWEKIPVGQWSKSEQLKNPIGSGAFKLTKFVPDQYVELEKYKDYNLGEPKLDKIIFKVTNQDTAQSELIKGDIDIAQISSFKQKDIDAYKSAGIKVSEYTSVGYQFMGINLNLPVLQDKKVRQAITYAINRKGIVDSLLDGHGKVVNTIFSINSWAHPDESKLNKYAYSADKSKALLKEAGWEDKNGVLYKDGKALELTLRYPTGNKAREQSAVLIQQNLKDVGIKLNLESLDFSTLGDKLKKQDYQLYLMGYSNDIDPNVKNLWYSSPVGMFSKYSGFTNSESDKLIDAATKVFDEKQRKKLYADWAKLWNEEVPAVVLYSANTGVAYNPKLKNYKPVDYYELSNVQNWYIDK